VHRPWREPEFAVAALTTSTLILLSVVLLARLGVRPPSLLLRIAVVTMLVPILLFLRPLFGVPASALVLIAVRVLPVLLVTVVVVAFELAEPIRVLLIPRFPASVRPVGVRFGPCPPSATIAVAAGGLRSQPLPTAPLRLQVL